MEDEQPLLRDIVASLTNLSQQIEAVKVLVEASLAHTLSKSGEAHKDAAAIFDRASFQLESVDLILGSELQQHHGKIKAIVSTLLSRAEKAAQLFP